MQFLNFLKCAADFLLKWTNQRNICSGNGFNAIAMVLPREKLYNLLFDLSKCPENKIIGNIESKCGLKNF